MTDSMDLQKKLADIRAEVRGQIIDDSFQVKGKDGLDVHFSSGDTQSLFKMRLCPINTQLNILNISNYDLRCHLETYRKDQIIRAIDLLGRKWVDRYCGEDFIFNRYCIPGFEMDRVELLKALKVKKCKLSDEQIEDVIKYFVGDRSEIKEKE